MYATYTQHLIFEKHIIITVISKPILSASHFVTLSVQMIRRKQFWHVDMLIAGFRNEVGSLHSVSDFIMKMTTGLEKWLSKVFATKPNNLSTISQAHKVKGRNEYYK